MDQGVALALSQRFDLPEIVGRILNARDIGIDEAPAFLEPRLRDLLPDPSHLIGMDEATARLADAIEDGEPIGIIADYDVDGATSCALLTRHLRALGASVHFDVPDRLEEGYGPNPKAFARLEGQGCRLVVVLDAGTTAFEPLEQAAADGHEVIVVDHHVAEESLPEALAVINPNRQDQKSPLGDLAAVGVTFMLSVALNRTLRQRERRVAADVDLRQWLDLVALGTVCDLVPLTGLNRALVAQGIQVAAKRVNPGLKALASAAKLDEAPGAGKFGFVLGPRINAGGRTGQSGLGARLLTDDDQTAAATIAAQLDALNYERRRIEKDVLASAERELQPVLADASVLVAAGEGWSPGVVGVVASRLVERYHRPAIVIGLEDGVGKGSGRSIKGFDLGGAVIAARQEGLLTKGGGHPMAAGLTIDADRIDALRTFLTERMTSAFGPGLPPPAELLLDADLEVQSLTAGLGDALDRLAPFGRGNPEPRLLVRNATLQGVRRIGDNHLDAWLADPSGARIRAVAFRIADQPLGVALQSTGDKPLHLAGRLKIDSWQGRRRPSFQIDDAAPA
ncbi:MAG: single-stranded-DNA-specific exonuclease RecJ [Geminicoccaceae bacterium]